MKRAARSSAPSAQFRPLLPELKFERWTVGEGPLVAEVLDADEGHVLAGVDDEVGDEQLETVKFDPVTGAVIATQSGPRDDVESAGLILTMARHHRSRVEELGGGGKVHLLGEYGGEGGAELRLGEGGICCGAEAVVVDVAMQAIVEIA